MQMAGHGNDTINGGSDTDTVDYSGDATITLNVNAGTVTNTTDTDTLTLSTIERIIAFTGLSDTIDATGYASNITVDLNTGAATGIGAVTYVGGFEHLTGGSGNDTLTGDANENTLQGGGGHDTLSGGAGNDSLDGGAGNDSVTGGAGDDTLIGGTGNDTLAGGDDSDTYASFTGSFGVDIIDDSAGDYDTLDLTGYDVADVTAWAAIDTAGDADSNIDSLRLTFAGGNTITIMNYFSNDSTDDQLVGAGEGYIETIQFDDDSYVDLTQVQGLV
jgi:Ca2+-binding RTX toxin-like protein